MNKILVVNGQFYAGENRFSGDKSKRVPIESQDKLNNVLCHVLGQVILGEIELKRIEIFEPGGGKA